MNLEEISKQHRVPLRWHGEGEGREQIIRGKYGHVFEYDADTLAVCFTDDGAKPKFAARFTRRFKTAQLRKLKPWIVKITQHGDYEFIATIQNTPESIEAAIRVLGVRRFKRTKGVSRPMPWMATGA